MQQDMLTIQRATCRSGKWITTHRLPAERATGRYLIKPSGLEDCTTSITDAWRIFQQLEELQAVAELQPKRKRKAS
jgi:hypothetical protein